MRVYWIAAAMALMGLLSSVGCNSYARLTVQRNFLQPSPYYKVADKPAPADWDPGTITATWIGHCTVLINFHGTTILTDPVLAKRLGLNLFGHYNIGIRRTSEAALEFPELPRIDLVLLSHAHRDHWDMATLKYFGAETTVIVPENTTDLVPKGHFGRVTELAWGQETQLGGLTVRAFRTNHWGARDPNESIQRGYNGYVIEGHGRRVVFVGDTADMPDFAQRVGPGPVELCILPIGGYNPYIHNHCSPEQAWEMFRKIGADALLATHWRTFIVSAEPVLEPMERLLAAAGNDARFVVCQAPGQTFAAPNLNDCCAPPPNR